jgi:hypothetical protein
MNFISNNSDYNNDKHMICLLKIHDENAQQTNNIFDCEGMICSLPNTKRQMNEHNILAYGSFETH